MKRIFFGLVLILAVASGATAASRAYFSDTETSTENSFTAGKIDLEINGLSNVSALVSFSDLKPGDNYNVPKIIEVLDNDAYVWMHIKDLNSSQGTQTDPEEEYEDEFGEKFDLENEIFYGLTDLENNQLIATSSGTTIAEAHSCWIPLGQVTGATPITINQSFYLPPSVGNWAQGDTLEFNEEFYAEQVRNNPNPTGPQTLTGRYWDPQSKTCQNCTPGQPVWVTSHPAFAQALRRNGTAVLPQRSTPANALGPNDGNGSAGTGFVSLGFGGTITLKFTFPVTNVAGNDLTIYEITNGRSTYPHERAKVEISQNGTTWFNLGQITSRDNPSGAIPLDVNPSGYSTFQYVRITDESQFAEFPTPTHNEADGFDVDAVRATSGTCGQPL